MMLTFGLLMFVILFKIADGAQVCLKEVDASRSNRVPIRYHGGVHRKEFKPLEALDWYAEFFVSFLLLHWSLSKTIRN